MCIFLFGITSLLNNTQADADMDENRTVTSGVGESFRDEVILNENVIRGETHSPDKAANLDGREELASTEGDLNDILILVNKTFGLSSNYKPNDLTIPNVRFSFEGPHEKQNIRQVAAQALEELFTAGDQEGIFLFAASGFRSYNRQQSVYNSHIQNLGQVEADKISAKPGHSEHQTGLAMDVTSHSAGFSLSEEFGNTKEGKWVAENAHKYGFIVRYPKGKEHLTEYNYEPWHLRYVGEDAAKEIFEKNLTLESYLSHQSM